MISVQDEHHLMVGDRLWFGQFHSESLHTTDLDWERRQFIVHFESNWQVSVIWGYCSYSDNHDLPFYDKGRVFNETPETVEAAILHADREGLQPDGEPFAYIDAEALNSLLDMVSGLATNEVIRSSVNEVLASDGEWDSTSET